MSEESLIVLIRALTDLQSKATYDPNSGLEQDVLESKMGSD